MQAEPISTGECSAVLDRLAIKQAVYEVIKSAGRPTGRNEIGHALNDRGLPCPVPAVDAALAWWMSRGHLEQRPSGDYQLAGPAGGHVS